jgi:hypothetical protein
LPFQHRDFESEGDGIFSAQKAKQLKLGVGLFHARPLSKARSTSNLDETLPVWTVGLGKR